MIENNPANVSSAFEMLLEAFDIPTNRLQLFLREDRDA